MCADREIQHRASGVNLAYLRKLSPRTRRASGGRSGRTRPEDMTGKLSLNRDGEIYVNDGDIHRPDQFVPGIFFLARFWASVLRRLIVVVPPGILELWRFNA